MSPDEQNPLFPDATYSYPRPPPGEALPHPVPLGPITTPLPRASSCWYTCLVVAATDFSFAIAAHAPRESILRQLLIGSDDTFPKLTFWWALRAHTSLPTTAAQFLSGPLVFPTHINNATYADWASVPTYIADVDPLLNIQVPQGPPLIILGLYNSAAKAMGVNLYLTLDPPPVPTP